MVPLFLSFHEFSTREGGRCRRRQKPATARNHPTPNDGYQACISNANAMEAHQSRPALPRTPFPRVEPWRVALSRSELPSARCSLGPKLARAMLLRSEALPVHRSLALKSGPCAVPPLLCFEPLPMRCYAFPSLRALARASFPSRRLVSVRQIGICAMCEDLGYSSRPQESRAGLQHRLLATALERWVRRQCEEFLTLTLFLLLLVLVVQLHFGHESC